MINMTWEFKLEPSAEQVADIEHILMVCSKVWNFALRERKDWLDSRKCPINACPLRCYLLGADEPFPNYHVQSKRLTVAKKEIEELRSVNAQVLQQVLRALDKSWERWRSLKSGLPRFKKRGRMRSFLFPQMLKTTFVRSDAIKLPKLGWMKLRWSREIPEFFTIKQARIVRKASGYFVMLSLEAKLDIPDVLPHGHPIGIDVGLEYFLSTSDGWQVKRPRFFNDLHSKLESLQRRVKNKQKGSNNWKKLHRKIARVHQRIADTRKDWHFKLAHQLCDRADMIFVEDLDFRIMAKGMLGKHTLDAGLGQFTNQILPWVCWKRDVYYAKVDPNGTSQECPDCGATVRKMLSDRMHHCGECGSVKPRDIAAAQVICTRGQRGIENACGVEVTGVGATSSSQLALKQEIFGAIRGISHHTDRLVG